MKPKTSLFAKSSHAAALATVFTFCLAGYSQALELNWNTTTGDFNNAANWLVGAGPGTGVPGILDNANISNGGTSQYTANATATVAEVRAGNGAAGTLEISGGNTFNTSGSTWVGRQSGAGVGTLTISGAGTIFNVNGGTTLVGAGVSGFGTATAGSTGVLNINSGAVYNHAPTAADSFRIGDTQGVAGNSGTYSGTLNVSGGTLNIAGARLDIGQGNVGGTATGVVNLSNNGAINANNNWVVVGRAGGTGSLNITSGTLTKAGANNFTIGDNGGATGPTVGTVTQSGGTIAVTGGEFFVGNGASTTGTYNLSGTGALTVNNWMAVGRNGASGTLNLTGGTITKTGTGANHLTIGTGGGTNHGIVNVSGGVLDIQLGQIYVGEGSLGTVNLTGSGEIRTNAVQVAVNNTANLGLVNLDGGTLRTGRIFGGAGNSEVDFNGTVIQATSSQTAFIDNLDVAVLEAGGAIIDSNGFNLGVGVGQALSGTGGLTKQGLGTLTLLGYNSYTGPTLVSGGKLVTTTGSYQASGPVTVADNASFGVNVLVEGDGIAPSSLTLGASSGIDIDLGFNGNATFAPIGVTGVLTINSGAGTIPINLAGSNLVTGQIPVISYGSLAGSGGFASFKVGTLPLGVSATLVNNTANKTIDLNLTVKTPVWTGAISTAWDTVTANWMDAVTQTPVTFANGDPVLFSDYYPDGFTLVTTSDVTLASGVIVRPGGLIQFNNSLVDYTLTGAGKISNPTAGTVGITKQGTASLTIGTINDHTGVTRIEGGRIAVDQLPNGGVASPIGASTSAPANLVLAGGALRYTGATTSTDRGFTVGGTNGTINVFNAATNLTMSGAFTATGTGSDFVKLGAGTLTLTGSGALSTGGNVRFNEGKTVLDGTGSAPAQAVTSAGGLWVGALTNNGASLDLVNTSLSIGGWLAVGRGNGDTGNVSSLSMSGGTLTAGNWTTGFANNLPNLSTQNLTFNNATVNITGASNIAESRGSTTNIDLTGNTVLNIRALQMGMGGGPAAGASSATLTVGGSSAVNVGSSTILSFVSIGRDGGTGNLIVKENGQFLNFDDFTLGEAGNSGGTGTITLQDNGIITVRTPLLGRGATNTALINQTGGTFSNFGDNNFQIGVNGNATWNLSAGTVNGYGWNAVGRYAPSNNCALNISGGTYNQVANDRGMLIGEEGTGTLNLSGTGNLNVNGSFRVGFAATGVGTMNQTGGTLTIRNNVLLGERGTATSTISGGQFSMNTGTGAFNFVVGNHDAGKATLNISGTADVRLARNASIYVGNTSTTASNTVNQTGGTVTAYSDVGTTVGGNGIVRLGNGTASGTNTYNLRGGTLAIGGITSGTTVGVSTSLLNLGGGTLRAVRDNAAFISNLTIVSIEAAGVVIDTNSFNVTATSALQDAGGGGGITKVGTGTLTLAGQNTYLGNTAINAGGVTLADDGRLRFFIGANGVTNKITGTGTATIDGDFNLELGSAAIANGNSWTLIDGSVNKSYGATFSVIGFSESGDVWTKVEGSNTWKFTESTGVLTLTVGAGSAYDSWISTYFPGVTDPNIIGATKDPDGDGSSNALEFALGGLPNSGSNGPKVYSLLADTAVDGDANKEQLITIAVRSGVTPAFSAAASPSAATSDGLTVYTIQGSLDLATFTSPVTPVTPAVTTNLPPVPSGYEYRTFSLNNSNGLAGKGFLRVKVN
jgi:autotransporter-associated beta strand protein